MPRRFNNVRGVRTPIPGGSVVGRPAGAGTGNGQLIPLSQIFQQGAAAGQIPSSAGKFLPTIADGDVLANTSGSVAFPVGTTGSALLDYVFGSAEGDILQRGSAGWQALAPGSANQVLKSGGSSALNSWASLSALLDAVFGSTGGFILVRGASAWAAVALSGDATISNAGALTIANNAITTAKINAAAVTYAKVQNGASNGLLGVNSGAAPSEVAIGTGLSLTGGTLSASGGGGVSFTNQGAWSGATAYNPGDVVQYKGSSYLNFSAVGSPSNVVSLDGSANSYTNATSPTVTLTTTETNDIIVVVVQAVSFSGPPSVSSISDGAGLTWHLHKQFQFTPSFPNANGYSDTEIWWAKAASALTGDVITVNTNATNNVALTAFGVNGAASLTSPFDTNVSLPDTNSSASNTSPAVTGVSTSIGTGDGFVIFTEMSSAHGGGWSLGTVTGYTSIALPHGGSVDGGVFYKHITSDLSSATITSSDSDFFWSAVATAIDGGLTPNTSPDQDDSHWLSQGNINTVDAAFSLSAGQLKLASIASGDVLGNSGSSSAEPVAATMTALIDRAFGSSQGDILYRGSSAWQVLAPGTSGNFLKTQGASANPVWAALTAAAWAGAPGGRLSLSSGAAVQTADVAGGTTIYYLPYLHCKLPVLGLDLSSSGVSLALDSNSGHTGYQQSGKLFDLFLYNNSGTLVLGTGPAWSSTSARGTGAGTTQIDQTTVAGAWTNTVSMTLKTDATSGTLTAAAGAALYVGTMYASANGQCTCQFQPAAANGGSAPIVGLYNAYNKVRGSSINRDNTASWTYSTNTWRASDGSSSNRVTFVDGLADGTVECFFVQTIELPASEQAYIGIGIDSISATPVFTASNYNTSGPTITGTPCSVYAAFKGNLGLHFVQMMENVLSSATFRGFFSGSSTNANSLSASLGY